MVVTANEILGTQHVTQDSVQFRGQRVFEINSDDIASALAATGLPIIGEPWSDLPSLKCRFIRWQHDSASHTWFAFVDYESDQVLFDPRTSTSYEQQDTWRINPVPNPSPSLLVDIGGAKIDQNGRPVQKFVRRQQIDLSTAYNTFSVDALPLGTWRAMVGSVNEAVFHGMAPHSVLYQGNNTAPIRPGRQVVTHSFLFDDNFHCVQFPVRDQNGDIATDGPPPNDYATTVAWRATWSKIYDFVALGV